MTFLRRLLLILVVLPYAGCAIAPRADSGEAQLVNAARNWLDLLDRQKYQDAWDRAAAHFRTANSQEAFLRYAVGVRRPLGPSTHREIWRQGFRAQVRGRPDGQYFIVSFRTTFAKAGTAVFEHVMLENERKSWTVSGYLFRGAVTHQFGANESVNPRQVFDTVRGTPPGGMIPHHEPR